MADEKVDLGDLAGELLGRAREAPSGRATRVLPGAAGGALTQVLLVLLAGRELSEHENPGEASLHVLGGRVRLSAGDGRWEVGVGGYVRIPPRRHGLVALEDSVVLLTMVRG